MKPEQRVLKNTSILYLKMGITIFISLYTTRIILNALGTEDYGIFNVVGGVIAMLGFLNAAMTSATQRFMSFAEGRGEVHKKKKIFNASIFIHIIIALIFAIVLEIVGYFFFNGILNIPENRVASAKIIFQFMILSTMFTIITVPYDAVLNSHENMLVNALVGFIQSILKLGIAFYVTTTLHDKLEIYGGLMALVTIFAFVIYRIYCHSKYDECEINFRKHLVISQIKEIGSFAGYSFWGYSTGMIGQYGLGVVLNMFFGTVLNAAQGITSQVSGQLMAFSNTMIMALNPVLVKSEGSGKRSYMLKASMTGSKLSFFLLTFFALPFLIETPFILKLWLGNVPEWTIIFIRFQLAKNLIDQLTRTLGSVIGAEGHIKKFSLVISVNNIVPLPLIYIMFSYGFPPYTMYIASILFWAIGNAIIHLYFARINCSLSIQVYVKTVILPCIIIFSIVFILSLIPSVLMEIGFIRFFITGIISLVSTILIIYNWGLTTQEKTIVIDGKRKIIGTFKNYRLS